MKVVTAPPDGSCFFHCIMLALNQELHTSSYEDLVKATTQLRNDLSSSITQDTLQDAMIYTPLFDQFFIASLSDVQSSLSEQDYPIENKIISLLNSPQFHSECIAKCLTNRHTLRKKLLKYTIHCLQRQGINCFKVFDSIDAFIDCLIKTVDDMVIHHMKKKMATYSEWADHYMIIYTSFFLNRGIIVVDENGDTITSTIQYFDKTPIRIRNIGNMHFDLVLDT